MVSQPAVGLGTLSPVRVKDVATLQGVQPVPLVGYGLVIGLNKSGDKRQTIFSDADAGEHARAFWRRGRRRTR